VPRLRPVMADEASEGTIAWRGVSGSTLAVLSRTSPWWTTRAVHIGAAKTLTTPRDFASGVLEALGSAMRAYGIAAGRGRFCSVMRPTIVTNALLEREGSARPGSSQRVVFPRCPGIAAVPRAGDLYDLFQDSPATLVPRRRRFEITGTRRRRRTDRGRRSRRRKSTGSSPISRRAARGNRSPVFAAVQLPQSNPRAEAWPAAGRAAFPGIPVYSLLGGAAGRSREFEAHQHDRGGAPMSGRSWGPIWRDFEAATRGIGTAGALPDGLERRRLRSAGGCRHAGDGRRVRSGSRRRGGRRWSARPDPASATSSRSTWAATHREGQPHP